MTKPVKFVATMLVPLAVAGTCLAAPALAATTAPVAADIEAVAEATDTEATAEEADASAQTAADTLEDTAINLGGYAIFGGIALPVPDTYTMTASADGTSVAYTNADGTAEIAIYDMSASVDLSGVDDLTELFALLAESAVAGFEDATLEDLGSGEFSDGTTGYAYGITYSDADGDYKMEICFIPVGDSFSYVVAGFDTSVDDSVVEEIANACTSIVLAENVDIDPTELGNSSCGLTFTVPEGLEDYGDGMWMGTEDEIMIMAMGGLAEGVSELADTDMEELLGMFTEEFGGEMLGSTTVKAQGVDVTYATFTLDEDGETYYIAVCLAPAADDSLSCILIMCDEAAATKYDEALTEMLESIAQA